jgi:hypothetical protein
MENKHNEKEEGAVEVVYNETVVAPPKKDRFLPISI